MTVPTVRTAVCCATAILSSSPAVRAEATSGTISLDAAVSYALAHHPKMRVVAAGVDAARARVDEAHTTELPGIGVSAEINRSTGNTVPGTFFPYTGFPVISGSPRGRKFDGGTFQTGASLWATWDVTSIAREAAQVDYALAGSNEARATTNVRRLEVAFGAADAYLVSLEATETVKAARAGVERGRVFATIVKSLVAQDLRPGVDAARADAELAVAETELAHAEQTRLESRAAFAQALGDPSTRFEPVTPAVIEPARAVKDRVAQHPLVREADAAAERSERAESVVKLEYLPRVQVLGAAWLRGSGYYGSPADGIVPDVPNWAVGATASWSILDIPGTQARSHAARADRDASRARRDDVALAVESEMQRALAARKGALAVLQTTPTALASATQAEQQALARYRSALSQAVEVADAERLLTVAQVNDAVARLEVLRAELLVARAAGDLEPFLARVRRIAEVR
jgi:outer membrane protein TolC